MNIKADKVIVLNSFAELMEFRSKNKLKDLVCVPTKLLLSDNEEKEFYFVQGYNNKKVVIYQVQSFVVLEEIKKSKGNLNLFLKHYNQDKESESLTIKNPFK